MLEVPIDSLESAINAINGGADELEVCSALNDGGLTPSIGLVAEVLQEVRKHPIHSRVKVNVMIRCRGGDDFMYSDLEMQTMLRDIQMFKELDVDRFVFGALTDKLDIDEFKSVQILAAASPKKVTFHRAFDLTSDYERAAEILVQMGYNRVLTSGQQHNVDQPGADQVIGNLAKKYNCKELIIMPGGGMNVDNVATFIKFGCSIVHSSCRTAVLRPKIERRITFGHTDNKYCYVTDESKVRELKCVIDKVIQGK